MTMKKTDEKASLLDDPFIKEICLGERITLGLMLLLRHGKRCGTKVDIPAKNGVFCASISADKQLTDLDRDTLEVLGWKEAGPGEYSISLDG